MLLALHKGLQTPLGPCLMAGASPTLVGPGQAWLRLWGSRVRLLPSFVTGSPPESSGLLWLDALA